MKSEERWAYILIGVVVMGIITIMAVNYVLHRRFIQVDPETSCPTDETREYHSTLVLIDRTDPISSSQKRYLTGHVEKLMREFALFEKVAIYTIDARSNIAPVPIFERCNPGSAEEANVWYENPRQIRQTFQNAFALPFNSALEQSMANATSETSPIMETIQAVMSNHRLDARINRLRLVVISDMLQNVDEYSHYSGNYSFSEFCDTPYASRVSSYLLGVGVTLVYLWRPNLSPQQADQHIMFWEQYVKHNGGHVERVVKVR